MSERFRDIVSGVLLVGVAVSAVLIATGLVGAFLIGWDGSMIGATSAPFDPTDFSTVVANFTALRPIAFAQAGLLCLLATPGLRIVASFAAFALDGDRLYTAITFVVLMILVVSTLAVR